MAGKLPGRISAGPAGRRAARHSLWISRSDGTTGQLYARPGLLRRVLLGIQRELKAQGFKHLSFLSGHGSMA